MVRDKGPEVPQVATVADPADLDIWELPPDEPRRYTVKQGDTWWGLARRWGVTPHRLAGFNGLPVSAILKTGQILAIPSMGTPVPVSPAPGRSL